MMQPEGRHKYQPAGRHKCSPGREFWGSCKIESSPEGTAQGFVCLAGDSAVPSALRRYHRHEAARLSRAVKWAFVEMKRLRKNSMQGKKQQIPRGLKPARDDKNEGFIKAHLKVRPFEASISLVRGVPED